MFNGRRIANLDLLAGSAAGIRRKFEERTKIGGSQTRGGHRREILGERWIGPETESWTDPMRLT